MFFGTYAHTLDDTGRLTIPSKLRDAIAASSAADAASADATAPKLPCIFLTCGAEKCIIAYTAPRVAQIIDEMKRDRVNAGEVREFKRTFGGEGAMESWDKQGRILLPEGLKAFAGITKDVTIVGAVDCFEIWDTAAFKARRDATRSAYDLIAGKVIT